LYYSKFIQVLNTLEAFAADPGRRSSPNIEVLLFLYIYTNRINAFFMRGEFSQGLAIVPPLLAHLAQFQQQLDPHRLMVFYYKIASLYFGSGDYNKAIEYLTKIIQFKDNALREDIQCFARILNLIAHYEAGRDESLDYQIKSVYRYLGKMNDQQQMQVAIFRFLRSLGGMSPQELRNAFIQLKQELTNIAANPFERRPFMYLDIISWLESKIENRPVQEIMQRKFALLK
jgi:tetratricopeptide (TPR) repeat protein